MVRCVCVCVCVCVYEREGRGERVYVCVCVSVCLSVCVPVLIPFLVKATLFRKSLLHFPSNYMIIPTSNSLFSPFHSGYNSHNDKQLFIPCLKTLESPLIVPDNGKICNLALLGISTTEIDNCFFFFLLPSQPPAEKKTKQIKIKQEYQQRQHHHQQQQQQQRKKLTHSQFCP